MYNGEFHLGVPRNLISMMSLAVAAAKNPMKIQSPVYIHVHVPVRVAGCM